jgi:hypothetical protein
MTNAYCKSGDSSRVECIAALAHCSAMSLAKACMPHLFDAACEPRALRGSSMYNALHNLTVQPHIVRMMPQKAEQFHGVHLH